VPKPDRILANLPPTFRTLGDPSALRALSDAYGGELQQAENSLVAVMRAHWVDFADQGEQRVLDLAGIGALYGLAPRADESAEEFRDHLKRHVRTFLEGTVTVTGLLRVTAEALGLHIEDDALDTWWTRADPVLVTSTGRGDDAAPLVLGVASFARAGHDALPAVIDGDVDLRGGVDLRERDRLWIALDGHGAVPVDLVAGGDPGAVQPDAIAAAIDAELGLDGFATVVDGRFRLTSATTGPDAQITIAAGPGDAADLVLGLRPRSYHGSDATHATVTGTADLSTAVDLTRDRYLRLAVDGQRLAEVDCAANAADPAVVDIGDIADAINDALGLTVATHDGRLLTLTSPTPGLAGIIEILAPAAQPATRRVLGDVPPLTRGAPDRRAAVQGDRDLGPAVDLRVERRLRLGLDAAPPVTVDVAGADPVATTPAEIVAAINEGLQDTVASHDGSRLTVASSTPGAASRLLVDEVVGDAAETILGLRSREARGAPPATAALTGLPDLSGGVDVSARPRISLAVDGAPAVEIDLRAAADDHARVTPEELRDAVNLRLGRPADDPVATTDGAHLILVSPTEGAGGSLQVAPLVQTRRRRFVTRARVTDDAATRVLGYTARRAVGQSAEAARIVGTVDLAAGADLRVDRYLRLRVDGGDAVEVNCAGPRARATTPDEIVERINLAAGPVAVTDGHTVSLVSPAPGADSSLVLEAPRSRDALEPVLGVAPGQRRGQPATGVAFTGTVDLAAGVELPADAAVRLSVDDIAATDVVLGDGAVSSTRPLTQLVALINQALAAQVAAHDGHHLLLTSSRTGEDSRLELLVPTAGTDVTADVLGVAAPRAYQGAAATAAEVVGEIDLTGGVDLTTARLLTLAVDAAPSVVVDLTAAILAGTPPTAVTAGQIAAAINSATTAEAAPAPIPGGLAVRIVSPTTGPASRLELLRTGAGDAAPLVLGAAGPTATGSAPTHATLDGAVDLLQPVDLVDRSVLRVAVDDAPALDVDVAGTTPTATLLDEIVAALDAALPGLASATPESRLRLTSPTEGPASSVEVVPLRLLELVEYPPEPDSVSLPVAHGTTLAVGNAGAAAVPGRVRLTTAAGVFGPRIADPAAGWSLRVDQAVSPGESLVLEVAADGQPAATLVAAGTPRPVPAELLEVVPQDATGVLVLGRGRNRWSYSECRGARFDHAAFDAAQFAGGPCTEEAVFDLSRFSPAPAAAAAAFAGSDARAPTAQVEVSWNSHTAGALEVNLPAELDRRFGSGFGDARFGAEQPERIEGVVTEPDDDDNHIVGRINDPTTGSRLVEADPELVPSVPIGWSAVTLPFRDPTPLTGGRPDRPARMYLSEPGFAPGFLELQAAEAGEYGNDITLTCRSSGPAIYDLEVTLAGSRFEAARQAVLGPPLPTLADELVQPGPSGVGIAKAAGIRAVVTRDRAQPPDPTAPTLHGEGGL
jgi:hypothetical protein